MELGRYFCFMGLLALLAGCGGGGPETPPTIRKVTAKVDSKAAPVTGGTRPVSEPLDGSPAAEAPTATTDPDAFEFVAEEPNWEIVGTVDPEAVVVNVSSLPEGADSSSFEFGSARNSRNTRGNVPQQTVVDIIRSQQPTGVPATGIQATQPASQAGNSNRKSGALPEGFVPVEGAEVSADGYPLRIICEKDGKEMAFVPAGVFIRGEADGPADAGPVQNVYLDPFYIDITEVTVDEYEVFREEIRDDNKRYPPPLNVNSSHQQPVLGVTWGESLYYSRWAGKQLPTEAQWEKAARGTEGFQHVWGNGRVLWHRTRVPKQIDEVMSFRTDISPYGVFDLAGNAREWCADLYAATAYAQAVTDAATVRNPPGPKSGSRSGHRVVRGSGDGWFTWGRDSHGMSERSDNIGFRCVLTIPISEEDDADDAEKPASPARKPKSTL